MDVNGEGKLGDEGAEKWISHYCSSERILLVGEGDFSFSSSLAKAFGSATNMVATSLDSKEMVSYKYMIGTIPVEALGGLVLHGVDVNEMHKHPTLSTMKFDRIIFNFPHDGHIRRWEHDAIIIKLHRELVLGFFKSAKELMGQGGEIHVSHRDDYPYMLWNLEELARIAGLALVGREAFNKADYPGNNNKRGDGLRSNSDFPLKDPFTFKFSLSKNDARGFELDDVELSDSMLLALRYLELADRRKDGR